MLCIHNIEALKKVSNLRLLLEMLTKLLTKLQIMENNMPGIPIITRLLTILTAKSLVIEALIPYKTLRPL